MKDYFLLGKRIGAHMGVVYQIVEEPRSFLDLGFLFLSS